MPTNNQEFITYGAYALKQLLGVDIAIAAMNGGNIIGIARDTRGGNARSISTPIVNLLRTIQQGGHNWFVCTTAAPTEACLGIAKLCRVPYIYEFVAAGFVRRSLTGNPPWVNQLVPLNPQTAVAPNSIPAFGQLAAADQSAQAAALFNAVAAPAERVTMRDSIRNWIVAEPLLVPFVAPPPGGGPVGGPITRLGHRLFMYLAHSIVAARVMSGGGAAGHSIGCVLVDNANSQILRFAVNSVTAHPTLHAEALVVMQFPHGLPPNSRFYTTLQCCHMCASFVTTAGAGQNVNVFYAQTDPIQIGTALARQVNGCTETHFDHANFGHQVMTAVRPRPVAPPPQLTAVLNSQIGTVFSMESIHAYRRLQHYVPLPQDQLLWQQGQAIINGILPGAVCNS